MKSRDRISFGLLGAALLVSVLVVGGVHRETQAIVAVLTAAALAVQLFARRRLEKLSPLLFLIGIAIVLTAVQLIPLPESLRHMLDSHGEALKAEGAAIAGTSPWPCLSNDPAGTLRALVYLIILFGIGSLALRFAASERGRYNLLSGVAGACGLAAVVAGIHEVVNAQALYGVYAPQHATPEVLGPLLNGNHMGCLMAFGAVLSLGLAFYPRQNVKLRVLWIMNTFACVFVAFATLSRGAVLAVAFGMAMTGASLIAQRLETARTSRHGGSRRRTVSPLTGQLPIAIVIAFGLGIAIYSSAGRVAAQLDNTSLTELSQPSSKYAAWKSSIELIKEAPILGIGRGALEPTFTRIHEPAAYVTFSHLENEYLQAVVEWGILGALVLAIGFGWCVSLAFKKWRESPLAAAALGAISGVLLQSTVDFGIELLGLAVPVTIAAATLLAVPLREPTATTKTRVMRLVLVCMLAIAGAVVMSSAVRSVGEDHDALLAEDHGTVDQAKEVIERHPLDYFGFGHAAGIMMRTNDQHAPIYLNHALELHPTHPGLHRLVARILVASNRKSQAAVQYALAIKGSVRPGKLLSEVLVLLPNVDDAAAALPTDHEHVEIIARELQDVRRIDVELRWLTRVIVLPQPDTMAVDKLYELAMLHKEWDFAELAARARMRIAHTTTSQLMLARVHAKRGGKGDLILSELADVATWHGRIDEKTEAWLFVCDVRIERKQYDQASSCLHRLDGSGAVTPPQRNDVTKRLNHIKEERTLAIREEALRQIEEDLQKKQFQPKIAAKPRVEPKVEPKPKVEPNPKVEPKKDDKKPDDKKPEQPPKKPDSPSTTVPAPGNSQKQ